MKKIIVLIISVLLLIGVMSCSGSKPSASGQYTKCFSKKGNQKRAYYNSIQYR
ncbi:MAG: hypothetical protein ACJ75J_01970 [Cytophagaceae bacterium]